MTIIEQILEHWVHVAGYDPNQKQFNLLSSNYAFHRCGERIEQLLKFDSSGVFAAVYAKASFETICKSISCKLPDLLSVGCSLAIISLEVCKSHIKELEDMKEYMNGTDVSYLTT